MLQTMVYGADVDVVETNEGKAILVTHPAGHQLVVPLTGEQELTVRRKLSDLTIPSGGMADAAETA